MSPKAPNNYGLLVLMKESFKVGMLDVIHFVGFVDPPTQAEVDKLTADLKASKEFMDLVGDEEWFLLPTVGLLVQLDNMLVAASGAQDPMPEAPKETRIVLPFGNPKATPSLILPPGM